MKKASVILLVLVLLASAIPVFAAYEFIVDNPNASSSGAWTVSTAPTDKYGKDYYYAVLASSGSRTFTFTPNIPATASDWQIFVWYPTQTKAATAAQYTVKHAGGTTTVNVNQTTGIGTWVSLGTFTLNAGKTNYVQLSNKGSDTTRTVAADSVRFYSASVQPPAEYRAAWAQTWVNGILNATQVSDMINTLDAANYNVVVPEVRKCGDAYYTPFPVYCPACGLNHSESRASNINDPDPDFDPLQDIINKAHAEGMEVDAWLVAYRIWNSGWGSAPSNHVWANHPDWAMKNSSGSIADGANYDLDPGVPAVQQYIASLAKGLVSRYDIDGLNWDYIRYPGNLWGYNEITQERFRQEYGVYPPTSTTDPNWGNWSDFRRQQVTDLVKKVYLEILSVNPQIRHSVDTVGWMEGDPNVDFTGTRQYYQVFQDSKTWMEQHLIDANILMNYKRDYDTAQFADYRLWSDWLGTMASTTGRHSYNGPAIYLNYIQDSMTQMWYSRFAVCQGIASYSYQSTNYNNLRPNSEFYAAILNDPFKYPAPIPEMPWKTNPTTGIIFGQVSDASHPHDPIYLDWIYKATVTVSGPVTQSTITDATGTYGFMDLPPGTYTITVSKSGFPTRVYYNQAVSVGQVLREDFELGYTTISSTVATVKAPWTLLSLPLEPVNPDPVSVFAGVDIDAKLMRLERFTGSLATYDAWQPDLFGNVSSDEGYWLRMSSTPTVSYQAWAGTPATHTTHLPRAGWSIIGCPFLTDRVWGDTLVTKGTSTVSLQTAAKQNLWLNSLGLAWDPITQGLYDIGLPDEWPTSTVIEPWHGYWIQSYTNDLYLIQR